jgi:hypothetical protein
MLSALILAADGDRAPVSPDALVRTLAALVPAAIEGLVRDLAIAGLAGQDLASIADHAGCEFSESVAVSDVIGQGLKLVRGPHVFVLRAGYAPEAGFIEEIGDFLGRSGAGERGALMRQKPETFWPTLVPVLSPAVGMISTRSRMVETGAQNFASLLRQIKPQVTLRARGRRVD